MEVTGKIIQKLELQSGTSKAGNAWTKQEYVLETIENFPKKIQEIIQYLSDNISTVRNLDQIAEKFYISKYHLSHLFKSQTGFSLIDFLIKTKISHSMHLLQSTDKSVVEISELCGFESSSYFCIAFKDKLKMTPLAYRKLVQTKK